MSEAGVGAVADSGLGSASAAISRGKHPVDESAPLCEEGRLLKSQIHLAELGERYGFRWFHVGIFLTCSAAEMSFASLAVPMPYLLEDVQADLQADSAVVGFFGTAVILGSILGVVLGGCFGDLLGRRSTIAWCLIIIVTGNLLHFAIPREDNQRAVMCLLALRTLLGVPYGGLFVILNPYLVEFFADGFRGTVTTIKSMAWNVATIYALFFLERFNASLGWRASLALIPMLPSCLTLLFLAYSPESPRWLFVAGHRIECQKSVDWIFSWPQIFRPSDVGKAPEIVDSAYKVRDVAPSSFGMIGTLFGPELRFATIMSSVMFLLLAGCGNVIWAWGPQIVEQLVGPKADTKLFASVEMVSLAGMLVAAASIDVVGRRPLLVLSFSVQTLALGALAMTSAPQGAIFLWLLLRFAEVFMWAAGGMYICELFPTMLRGTGVGIVCFCGRVSSVLMPVAIGEQVQAGKTTSALISIAAIAFLGALSSCCLPHDMAGRALTDEIET